MGALGIGALGIHSSGHKGALGIHTPKETADDPYSYTIVITIFSTDLAASLNRQCWASLHTWNKRYLDTVKTNKVWASRYKAFDSFSAAVEAKRSD